MDALETEVQQETQVPLGSVHQEKTELLDHQDLLEERDSEEITVETETQVCSVVCKWGPYISTIYHSVPVTT